MFSKAFKKFKKRKYKYTVSKKPAGIMISSSERKPIVKMAGYLEKKSKMRVVCRWKKLWFVLEGRLLLYYKSQLEYLSLSPCRGTVNLGLAANVVPGKSNEIIVSTRSHTVSLRALNRADHDVWLQALIDAMCLPNSSHTMCCAKPVHHFRYSTGVLEESERMLERVQQLEGHAHTLSARLGSTYAHNFGRNNAIYSSNSGKNSVFNNVNRNGSENELEKNKSSLRDVGSSSPKNHNSDSKYNSITDYGLDKLTKKFSKIAVSDTSIPGKFRLTTNDEREKEVLRRSASVENDFVRFSENIYESVKELEIDIKEIIPKKKKLIDAIKRSDSDRIISRRGTIQSEFRSEQKIKSSCDDSPVFRNKRERHGFSLHPSKSREKMSDSFSIYNEKRSDFRMKPNRPSAVPEDKVKRLHNKDIKSDTDLSIKRHRVRQSGSCDAITMNRASEIEPIRQMIESTRFSEELNKFRAKMLKDSEIMKTPVTPVAKPSKARRSNSLLRRFSRESSKESYDSGVDTGSTPKKRSLSFLKKMWKKKEKKWDTEDESFSINPNPLEEMQGPNSDIEEVGNYSGIDLSINYEIPQPEPPPDYDEVNASEGETEPPQLPPRRHWAEEKRPPSPWHDIPTNNQPIIPEPPALPAKVRKRQKKANTLDFLFHDDSTDNDSSGLRFLFREESSVETNKKSNGDLGDMLAKLTEINMTPLESFHYFADDHSLLLNSESSRREDNDPDYDVPRPHASLLATLRKQSTTSDSIPATHFFSHYEDSLDPQPLRDEFDHLTMAPDSLECDPWSLSNEADVQTETWAKYAITTNTLSIEPTAAPFAQESLYQDSLNATLNNNREDCITFQKGFLKLYS